MNKDANITIPYNPTMGLIFLLIAGLNGMRLATRSSSALSGLYVVMIIFCVLMLVMHFAIPFFRKVGNTLIITNNYFTTKKIDVENILSIDFSSDKKILIQTTDNSLPVTVLIRQASTANRKKIIALLKEYDTQEV